MSVLTSADKTKLGIQGTKVDFDKLTKTEIPEESSYGIPVLNKLGYEKTSSNEYIDAFVESALNADKPLLEIGAAFGNVVQRVLERGATVTACDISSEHLEIIIKQAPKEYLENLYVYPAKFPEEITFPKESFSSILASRILHFLSVDKLEESFLKIRDWLIPGGKFYFIALSVYHESIREGFFPTYLENVKKGLKWCGLIEDQHKFAPQHISQAPSFVHVFNIPELAKIIPDYGFRIEKMSLFAYPDDKSSGEKGHVGFVAVKV